jgi:Zn-dependent protease
MQDLFIALPVLLFSVIVHEVAHGWVALRLGDPTARDLGRLTLHPAPHVDPVMSFLVPALCIMSGAPVFGGAKPVPVNPNYFRHPSRDMAFVALAGPVSNLILAFIASVAYKTLFPGGWGEGVLFQIVSYGYMINMVLAAFNLLPLPPLDGSRILAHFLKGEAAIRFRELDRYGMFLIMGVIFFFRGALTSYLRGFMRVMDVFMF